MQIYSHVSNLGNIDTYIPLKNLFPPKQEGKNKTSLEKNNSIDFTSPQSHLNFIKKSRLLHALNFRVDLGEKDGGRKKSRGKFRKAKFPGAIARGDEKQASKKPDNAFLRRHSDNPLTGFPRFTTE